MSLNQTYLANKLLITRNKPGDDASPLPIFSGEIVRYMFERVAQLDSDATRQMVARAVVVIGFPMTAATRADMFAVCGTVELYVRHLVAELEAAHR